MQQKPSRQKNPDIGTCPCYGRDCGTVAHVRKIEAKRANLTRYYLNCPECGRIDGQGQKLQQWIKEKATFFDPAAGPPPKETPKAAPAATPARVSESPKKDRSWSDRLCDLLD